MTDQFLSGVDEMILELHSLEQKAQKKVGEKAARAGAAFYRKSLKRQLKRKATTGKVKRTWKTDVEGKKGEREDVHLWNRIGIRKRRGRRNYHEYRVGYTGLAKEYGHIIEYGKKGFTGNRIWTKTLRRARLPIFNAMKDELRKQLFKRIGT